ncbi:MAG: Rrf2 family transcriptional regulator, partial [bacterium]|nr:Rrf2 family transcriptional regulator [bacterium]
MPLLSQTAEYAIRATTHLAQHHGEGHVMAKDVAKATAIPEKYLQKILRDLVHHGLLKSTRGHGGGFHLAKPPSRIRLAHVVSPFEQ